LPTCLKAGKTILRAPERQACKSLVLEASVAEAPREDFGHDVAKLPTCWEGVMIGDGVITMDQNTRKTLLELQAQLRHTESLPEHERQIVEELYEEIEQLLARPRQKPPVKPDPLLKRLEGAAERFEITHPDLTVVIERIIDSLSTMGI
jgi:hypothetical protein